MQWVLEKFPLGRAFLTVGEDPGDAAAYARLGGSGRQRCSRTSSRSTRSSPARRGVLRSRRPSSVRRSASSSSAWAPCRTRWAKGRHCICAASSRWRAPPRPCSAIPSPTSGRRARRSPSSRRRTSSSSPMRSTAATRRVSRAPSARSRWTTTSCRPASICASMERWASGSPTSWSISSPATPARWATTSGRWARPISTRSSRTRTSPRSASAWSSTPRPSMGRCRTSTIRTASSARMP